MNNVKRSRTAKAVLLTGISLVALSVFAVQRGVSLYGVSVNNLDFYYAVPEDYYEDPVPYTGYQVEQYVQYDSYSSGPAAFSSVSIGIDEEDSMSACDETSILYAPDNCHSTYYQNQNQQQMSSIAVPYPDYDSGNPCDPNSLAYDPTACDQLERSLYEFSASSPSLPPATPSPTFCQYNPSHPSCTSSSSSGGCDICDQNCVDYDPSQCGGTPRPAPFPQPSPSPTICQINPSDPSCTSSSSGNCDICDQNCVDYDPSQCGGTPHPAPGPLPSPQPVPSPSICQINPSDPSCTSSSSGNCDICDQTCEYYDPSQCGGTPRPAPFPQPSPSPTICQINPSDPSCTSSSSGNCDICDQTCEYYDPSQCGGTPRPAPFPQPSPSPTICQINPSDPSCTSSSSGNCDICDQNCVDYDPSQCSGTPPRPSPQQSRVADAESTSATVINTVSIGYLTLNREMINNIINLMRQMYGGG